MAEMPKGLSGYDASYWKLGDYIYDQNPYGSMEITPDLEAAVSPEVDKSGIGKDFSRQHRFARPAEKYEQFRNAEFWHFNGTCHRISKAIRIRVRGIRYDDSPAAEDEQYILIGYVGAGGM
jgi:hypothetical protein